MCNGRNLPIAAVLTSVCEGEATVSIQNKPTSDVTPETTTDTHEVIHLSELLKNWTSNLMSQLSDNEKKQLLCFLAKNGSGFAKDVSDVIYTANGTPIRYPSYGSSPSAQVIGGS